MDDKLNIVDILTRLLEGKRRRVGRDCDGGFVWVFLFLVFLFLIKALTLCTIESYFSYDFQ
jgi:hypothetical protein